MNLVFGLQRAGRCWACRVCAMQTHPRYADALEIADPEARWAELSSIAREVEGQLVKQPVAFWNDESCYGFCTPHVLETLELLRSGQYL